VKVAKLSEEVSIDYRFVRSGWSELRPTVGAAGVVLGPFGFLSDALGDLVRAALMIATSAVQAEVGFDGEPSECRLIIGPYHGGNPPRWIVSRRVV
jgi:hypothetical protein